MKFFKALFFLFVFIGDNRVSVMEKVVAYIKLLLAIGPIAYVLDLAGIWFSDNKKFVTFFVLIVIVNALLGLWKHKKQNQFNWEEFFIKTGKMLVVVILTYFILAMTVGIAGENYVASGFEVSLQVATLFFPASKALKSLFVISNGEYPPKWIMKKVYNFEEDGDLNALLKTPEKQNNYEE